MISTDMALPIRNLFTIDGDVSGRRIGSVTLPGHPWSDSVMILEWKGELVAVPSRCPHQGYDLAEASINARGELVCPQHGRAYPLEPGNGFAFPVERRGDELFVVDGGPSAALEEVELRQKIRMLEAETDALRSANQTLEGVVLDIYGQMDAMLREVEARRRELEDKGRQLESLAGLVSRITESIHDILLVAGLDGRVIRVSRGAIAFFGVDVERLIGVEIDTLLHPDELERLRSRLSGASWSGRPLLYDLVYADENFEAEVSLRALIDSAEATGSPVASNHLLHGSMLYDFHGKEEGIILLISNISGVKQREQITREREMERALDRLRATIANIDQGILMFDADMRLVVWNRRYLELLEMPEDIVRGGASIETLFRYNAERGEYGPGDPETQVADHMALAARNEAHHFERTRPNGIVLEVTGRPLPDGGLVTTYTDITEHRNARQLLEQRVKERTTEVRRSEERFRHLAESASDWFWETDSELRYSYFSERFYEVTGIAPDDVLGKTRRQMAGEAVKAEPEKWDHHFDDLDHHRPFRDLQYRLPVAGGREIFIQVNGTPYFDESGGFLGFRGTAADMSHIVESQKELVRAEKMAALGGLVAGVAHEINTPLGISLTAASHAKEQGERFRQLYDQGKATKSSLESFINTSDEALSALMTNLLRAADLIRSFKLIAVDQASDIRRRFDLAEYIREVLLSLQPHLRRTYHVVDVTCPEGLVLYSCPGAFSQILTNLVLNSLMHAFDEGCAGQIRIDVSVVGEEMVLVYGDDGKGMSADVASKIFDPFFTTKRGQGGSGLGMHIVYNLVIQTLGGQIACRTAPGEGLSVTLRAPLNRKASNA